MPAVTIQRAGLKATGVRIVASLAIVSRGLLIVALTVGEFELLGKMNDVLGLNPRSVLSAPALFDAIEPALLIVYGAIGFLGLERATALFRQLAQEVGPEPMIEEPTTTDRYVWSRLWLVAWLLLLVWLRIWLSSDPSIVGMPRVTEADERICATPT